MGEFYDVVEERDCLAIKLAETARNVQTAQGECCHLEVELDRMGDHLTELQVENQRLHDFIEVLEQSVMT